jgi:Family of unknown function (DUF6496)
MAKRGRRRKYSPKAALNVERSIREMKRVKLPAGRSGKKVKSRKQAIAIRFVRGAQSGCARSRKGKQEKVAEAFRRRPYPYSDRAGGYYSYY